MTAVLWGKLVLNLGNALNALSGLPLAEQFADRRWRLLLAAQMDEALAVMRARRHQAGGIGALRPALLPYVLRLPDFLFRMLARRMIAVDPEGAILDLAGPRARAPHRDRRIPGRHRAARRTGRDGGSVVAPDPRAHPGGGGGRQGLAASVARRSRRLPGCAEPRRRSDSCAAPSISVIFCQILRDRLEPSASMSLTASITTSSLTDCANSAATLPVIDSISEQ